MPLVVGSNAYLDVATAGAYFEFRLDADAWADAKSSERGAALVSATRLLDSLNWIGRATDSNQSLAFPRIGNYRDPKIGAVVSLGSAEVPQRVLDATCELALHLLRNPGVESGEELPDSIAVEGAVSLTGLKSTKTGVIPAGVYRGITPLLERGNNSWWRAN